MAQASHVRTPLCAQMTGGTVEFSTNRRRSIFTRLFVRPAGRPPWIDTRPYSETLCIVDPVNTTAKSTS
jgi:hypothetical protein